MTSGPPDGAAAASSLTSALSAAPRLASSSFGPRPEPGSAIRPQDVPGPPPSCIHSAGAIFSCPGVEGPGVTASLALGRMNGDNLRAVFSVCASVSPELHPRAGGEVETRWDWERRWHPCPSQDEHAPRQPASQTKALQTKFPVRSLPPWSSAQPWAKPCRPIVLWAAHVVHTAPTQPLRGGTKLNASQ